MIVCIRLDADVTLERFHEWLEREEQFDVRVEEWYYPLLRTFVVKVQTPSRDRSWTTTGDALIAVLRRKTEWVVNAEFDTTLDLYSCCGGDGDY